MSEGIDTPLVLAALAMARSHRQPTEPLLFHSDRGVQYASKAFRDALQNAAFLPSMSRKGNGDDNASRESFWRTLKLELVYRQKFQSHAQARSAIFD